MICDWRDSADLNHLRGSPRMALACSLCELCLESPGKCQKACAVLFELLFVWLH